jgi:transcriptional regulator EpsA
MNAREGLLNRQQDLPLCPDAFARFVARSLEVKTEADFVALSRNELQSIFPHGMLLAGIGHAQGERIAVRHAIGVDYPREYVEKLRDQFVWAGPVLSRWLRTREPQLFDLDAPMFPVPNRWGDALRRRDMRNIAAHGVRDVGGSAASYFSFSRLPGPLDHGHRKALEIFTPLLHQALLRTRNAPRLPTSARGRPRCTTLTDREREVLRWVALGKSNADIAAIAGRSEHTVRNQVSAIYDKLGVANRLQALAAATELALVT